MTADAFDQGDEFYMRHTCPGDSPLPIKDRDEFSEFDVWLMAALQGTPLYWLSYFRSDLRDLTPEACRALLLEQLEYAIASAGERIQRED